MLEPEDLLRSRAADQEIHGDRLVATNVVRLVDATRHPGRHGLDDLAARLAFAASPRASRAWWRGPAR